ncbi:hypothetical protein ISCGN_001466 [Ixodes scapularis]
MVERLSEQRRAVSEFFEDSTKHYLVPQQWSLLKAMATVSKPFEEATRLLRTDTSTLGQVLPLLTFIERTVTHTMAGAELDTPAFYLASCLLNTESQSTFQCCEDRCSVLGCYPTGSSFQGHIFHSHKRRGLCIPKI